MTQFGDFIEPKKKKVNRNDQNELTAHIRGNQPQPRQNENVPRDYDQVKVENGSGYAVDPFAVLRIHNATWPERTDQKFVNEGMRNGVESLGVKPSSEWNQISVLQKSAPDGSFAQGVCSGPTPVFVLFRTQESLDYPFAIPLPEDSSKLVASPYGLNRILWHTAPSENFQECTGEVLQSYVNMGEDGQWVWWKLKSDLSCCGSAVGQLCDECGTVLQSDCPIERTIYAPKGLNLCGCENSCGTWKQNDIVPAWWFQYLEKWVTIPNFHAGLEEKEMEVVTSLTLTGGTVTPTTNYQTVVTDVTIDTNLITLGMDVPRQTYCLEGAIEFGNDAKAKGSVTVTGTIGSAQNPIELEVTSQSNLVTIYDASLTSDSNISLTGSLSGSATVTVPLNNVSLGVSGTASGPLTLTNGNVSLNGSCTIPFNNLPNLNVTGSVIKTSQADPVTLGGHSTKTLLSGATINTTTHNLKIPPLTGTLTGSLRTGSGVPTTNADRSGLRATIDLSSIFEMAEAVKEGTLDIVECELTYETINVLKFKQGKTAADLQNIPVTFQGDITVPSSVSCNFDYSETGATTTTIKGVDTSTNGGLTTTTDSVSIPTTATLHLDRIGVTGTAEWPQTLSQTGLVGTSNVAGTVTVSNNNVSLNVSGTATGSSGATATGTATITDTVTVSGPLSISSGVYIRGQFIPDYPMKATGTIPNVTLSTSEDVELGLSGTIENNQLCYVDVPTALLCDEGWFDVTPARVPFPSVDLTGATISGTTSTIKYVACADCPEPEEEEE